MGCASSKSRSFAARCTPAEEKAQNSSCASLEDPAIKAVAAEGDPVCGRACAAAERVPPAAPPKGAQAVAQLVAPPPAGELASRAAAALVEAGAGPLYGLSPRDPYCGRGLESERLAALRALNFVGQETGPRFGALTGLLRSLFGVPAANIFLFEAEVVLPVPDGHEDSKHWPEYPRCETVCRWVVGEHLQHKMLIVEDLSRDARFSSALYVAGPPYVRFYASTPLVSTDRGLCYGTLCIFDFQPRTFRAEQYQMLPHLAEIVVREVEGSSMLRWHHLAIEEKKAGVQRLVRGLDCFSEAILVCDVEAPGWAVEYANSGAAVLLGLPQDQLAGAAFWQLFQVSSRTGSGNQILSKEDIESAVASGRSCKLTCRLQLAQADHSATSSATAPVMQLAAESTPVSRLSTHDDGDSPWQRSDLKRGGSCVTWGRSGSGLGSCDLESVLAGQLAPEALLRPAASGPLPLQSPLPQPEFTVTLTPAAAPEFRPDEPPVGIPAPLAEWNGASDCACPCGDDRPLDGRSTAHDCSSESHRHHPSDSLQLNASGAATTAAAGTRHSADDVTAAGPAAPAGACPSRLWFATITGPALSRLGSANSTSTSGSMGSRSPTAVVGTGAASVEYLRPRELADVTLGPLLGAGASGRTYRGLWFGGAVAVKIIDVYDPTGRQQNDEGVAQLAAPGHSSSSSSYLEAGRGSGSTAGEGGGGAAVLEALLSRALSHPHIVSTHAWGVGDGGVDARGQRHQQVWIVQTLCSLGTLIQAIDTGRFREPVTGGPHVKRILQTAAEVAGALAFLHSVHVVHGDLTGNNVLLSPAEEDSAKEGDERGFVAMVADFGLSRPTSTPLSTVPRGTYGTVTHMAPELIERDEATPAVDSFAFGVVLWEMMAGKRAWRGMGPLQVIHAVTVDRRCLAIPQHWPRGVQDLVKACLASDPAQRPTADQILRQLQAMLHPSNDGL